MKIRSTCKELFFNDPKDKMQGMLELNKKDIRKFPGKIISH